MRDAKKRVKELAEALKREPGSIPKRLELAAALREADKPVEAIDLYRGVAEAYAEEGRLVQAIAVCKGILEIDPEHRDIHGPLLHLSLKPTILPDRFERGGPFHNQRPQSRAIPTFSTSGNGRWLFPEAE